MRSWSILDYILVWLGGIFVGQIFLVLIPSEPIGFWILGGIAGSYAGYAITIWLLSRRKEDADLGLTIERKDLAFVALGLFLQITITLLIQPLANLLIPEGTQPQEITERLLDASTTTQLKIAFFAVLVVLTPVFEELVYRGVLLRALLKRGRKLAIFVSALVFASVHALDLDLNNFLSSAAVVLPPIFVLALILGWVTVRNGRLGPAIFIHSGWNLLGAIILLVPNELLQSVN